MHPSDSSRKESEETLRRKLKSDNRARPIPNLSLFANGKYTIYASSKIMWEASNILTRKQDLIWQDDLDSKRSYTSETGDGKGKLDFWVSDIPEALCPEALAGEAATTVIQTFDVRAVCMHLIYAAHATALNKPWEEEFVIDDQQIATYLGLDKRKDLKKQDKLKLIERLALQPAQILTRLSWSAQGNVGAFYVEKSRLWEIAIGYHALGDASGQTKIIGLTIRGRAGLWAKYLLNRQGKAKGSAFFQYGVLSKKLLQAISRVWQHNPGAARMLAWLAFRTRVGRGKPLIATTLMEIAYGPDKVAAAYHDPEFRAKLADTWDNDLLILNDEGWGIEFDLLTYPPDVQPCWKEGGRGTKKRPKGFWEQLRGGRMWVNPPQETLEGIAELQGNKQKSSR